MSRKPLTFHLNSLLDGPNIIIKSIPDSFLIFLELKFHIFLFQKINKNNVQFGRYVCKNKIFDALRKL
jgi:hypothetical protein